MYIAYTEQGENHETMIAHGVRYSAYTLRSVGSYYTYGIATFVVSLLRPFSGLLLTTCTLGVLTSVVFPAMLRC